MSYDSELNLKDIRVTQLEYELNPSVPFSGEQRIDISIEPKSYADKDSIHRGMLELEVRLFDKNYISDEKPLYLCIVVQGLFETNDTNKDHIFEMYLPNMISMVYSYVRTYVASLTGMFGVQNISIPTINVFKLLEEISKNSER